MRGFVGANGKAGILAGSVVIRVCQGHDTSTSCRFICFRLAASIETRVAAHALREVYKSQDSRIMCGERNVLSGWAQIKGILVFYNLHTTCYTPRVMQSVVFITRRSFESRLQHLDYAQSIIMQLMRRVGTYCTSIHGLCTCTTGHTSVPALVISYLPYRILTSI